MVGDGFGGRLWYTPTNYTVGSYSAYSLCFNDLCDTLNNQLYGWGDNGYNQLGLGNSITGVNLPTLIPSMSNVRFYSSGYIMGAIKNDNTGWIWGLGDTSYIFPSQIINDVKFMDAGQSNISFIKTNGTVWSIGDNNQGQLGIGTISNGSFSSIFQMMNISSAVRVANNLFSTIVLLDDSTLMATGSSYSGGYLGLGNGVTQALTPLPIQGLPPIIDIKSHQKGTIALTSNGDVYFWGTDVSNNSIFTPTLIPSLKNIVAISGGDDGYHFLALDENKNCYAWGANFSGQCGVPPPSYSITTPILVATNVIDIMAGEYFSYIVKSDGTLWATGISKNGNSIWLNLPDIQRDTFTMLDPTQMNGCSVIVGGITCDTETNSNEESIVGKDSIYIPNVFSPNNDGFNDIFYFPNTNVTDLKCKIFNRWGQFIYEFSQVNGSWDGRTNTGTICPEGTYYFIVDYRMANSDRQTKKGFVSLLR